MDEQMSNNSVNDPTVQTTLHSFLECSELNVIMLHGTIYEQCSSKLFWFLTQPVSHMNMICFFGVTQQDRCTRGESVREKKGEVPTPLKYLQLFYSSFSQELPCEFQFQSLLIIYVLNTYN